jgi:hypothetical protein
MNDSVNIYNPDYFYCLSSEPRNEWHFSLVLIGVSFIGFAIFYFIKIFMFIRKYSGYPLSAFNSRFLLLTTLLVHGISQILEGISYGKQWKVGFFKFPISHFSQFLTSSALILLLTSWMKIYTSCHAPRSFKIASKLKKVFVWFSLFMAIIFSILTVLKYQINITIYYTIVLSVDVIRNAITCLIFFTNVYQLSKITGRCLSCYLGNPGDYISTLSFFNGLLLFLGLQLRILLLVFLTKSSECSELNMFLRILLQCFGYLLPLGFISVIDTILPNPSKEAILELTNESTVITSPYISYV